MPEIKEDYYKANNLLSLDCLVFYGITDWKYCFEERG